MRFVFCALLFFAGCGDDPAMCGQSGDRAPCCPGHIEELQGKSCEDSDFSYCKDPNGGQYDTRSCSCSSGKWSCSDGNIHPDLSMDLNGRD